MQTKSLLTYQSQNLSTSKEVRRIEKFPLFYSKRNKEGIKITRSDGKRITISKEENKRQTNTYVITFDFTTIPTKPKTRKNRKNFPNFSGMQVTEI